MANGMCIKGWNLVMRTRRLLHIEEPVIHSSLGQAQACAMLCYMCSMSFRAVLCFAHPMAV